MAKFRASGSVWKLRPAHRSRLVTGACRALQAKYGQPRLGNPKNSVDDLVYIIVSNKTAWGTAQRTFRRLKRSYVTWDSLAASKPARLRSILKPAGLSRIKASQLQRTLRKIKADFGSCDLRRLKQRDPEAAYQYLTSLPGVSDKVAKCVMMYTMGAKVLPVDVHVHRIATRLGWTARKRADQCHPELESLVPPNLRHGFHVGCVLHGRLVCRPEKPLCENCCLKRYCEYFKKRQTRN